MLGLISAGDIPIMQSTCSITMVTWRARQSLAVRITRFLHVERHDRYLPQWTFYAGYSCELAADLIITATMVILFAQKNIGMRRYVYQPLRRSSLFLIILLYAYSSDRFTQTLLVYFLNSGLLVM